MREFHIGDILSITTGKLCSPRHMEGVYDICSYMAGYSAFTHQLPRIAKEATPVILAQHPHLAEVDTSGLSADTFSTWIAEQIEKFGERLVLVPGGVTEKDPITELADIRARPRT